MMSASADNKAFLEHPYTRRFSDLTQGYNWSPEYFPINNGAQYGGGIPNSISTYEMNTSNAIAGPVYTEMPPLSSNALPPNLNAASNIANDLLKKPVKKIAASKHKRNISSGPHKRPAFVLKLWTMVNDPKNRDYVTWSEDGESFKVLSTQNLEKYVLPKYFKRSNYSSFVRQLNMYGWHKVQDVSTGTLADNEVRTFKSPYFKRGREDLLDQIVRSKGSKGSDDEGGEPDLGKILDALDLLKTSQMEIASDLNRIKQENEMLWKECYESRERHKSHAQSFERILRFMASIYTANQNKYINDSVSPTQRRQRLLTHDGGNIAELPVNSRPVIEELTPSDAGNLSVNKEKTSGNVSGDVSPRTVETPASVAFSADSPIETKPAATTAGVTMPYYTAAGNEASYDPLDTTNVANNMYSMPNPNQQVSSFDPMNPLTTDQNGNFVNSYGQNMTGTGQLAQGNAITSSTDPETLTNMASNQIAQVNKDWVKDNSNAENVKQHSEDLENLIRNINYQADSLQRVQDSIRRFSTSGQADSTTLFPPYFDLDRYLETATPGMDPFMNPEMDPNYLNTDNNDLFGKLEDYNDMEPPHKRTKLQ